MVHLKTVLFRKNELLLLNPYMSHLVSLSNVRNASSSIYFINATSLRNKHMSNFEHLHKRDHYVCAVYHLTIQLILAEQKSIVISTRKIIVRCYTNRFRLHHLQVAQLPRRPLQIQVLIIKHNAHFILSPSVYDFRSFVVTKKWSESTLALFLF